MSWTTILGALLLCWVFWDLFAGSVWLHRQYFRATDPLAYWCTLLLWCGLAISCFYW